jgi:hypothetical protein
MSTTIAQPVFVPNVYVNGATIRADLAKQFSVVAVLKIALLDNDLVSRYTVDVDHYLGQALTVTAGVELANEFLKLTEPEIQAIAEQYLGSKDISIGIYDRLNRKVINAVTGSTVQWLRPATTSAERAVVEIRIAKLRDEASFAFAWDSSDTGKRLRHEANLQSDRLSTSSVVYSDYFKGELLSLADLI